MHQPGCDWVQTYVTLLCSMPTVPTAPGQTSSPQQGHKNQEGNQSPGDIAAAAVVGWWQFGPRGLRPAQRLGRGCRLGQRRGTMSAAEVAGLLHREAQQGRSQAACTREERRHEHWRQRCNHRQGHAMIEIWPPT